MHYTIRHPPETQLIHRRRPPSTHASAVKCRRAWRTSTELPRKVGGDAAAAKAVVNDAEVVEVTAVGVESEVMVEEMVVVGGGGNEHAPG